MTVTSERERSHGRSRSLSHSPQRSISSARCRRPHRAGSREDHPADEGRSGPARSRARSAAPPAARNEDKDGKRTAGPAGSDRVTEIHPSRKAKDHRASARNATDAGSPLLAAQQMLRRRPAFRTQPVATEAKSQPAAQSSPVPMETEYRRSFQGASPSRGPRLRKHLERRQRLPAFHTRTKSQKMREESEKISHPQVAGPAHQTQDSPPPQVPRRHRKLLTEYQANFPGPRREVAGAPPQVALLRQKASWYRRRAWGTNFSRRHLSQLKSRHNVLWEPDGGGDADVGSPPSMEALDLARKFLAQVVGSAACVFLRHLGAGVLALLLIGCVRRGAAGPVYQPLSQVLRSPSTYQAAEEVSLHAQRSETEEESNIRLNVAISEEKDHVSICCLHANILDFYLNNVLNHVGNQHPRMHQLHSDLDRASEDLKERGCNAVHYRDHRHVARFRNKLAKMDNGRGLNKALSEVNILFTYLHDSCVSVTH